MTAKIPAKANPTAMQIPQMFQYKVKSFILYDVNKKRYCQGRKECCAGRSEFFLRAEPERSEGGWSEEIKNREGVASGSATHKL